MSSTPEATGPSGGPPGRRPPRRARRRPRRKRRLRVAPDQPHVSQTIETLPATIQQDASTGLPLLEHRDDVLRLMLTYLPLPYSVAEHGCGKRASLTIRQLMRARIPAYALGRCMVMERDMSPGALAETRMDRRPHAITVPNPLYALGDLRDDKLRRMLNASLGEVEIDEDESSILAGDYRLHHQPTVQFVITRSHVMPVVTFWDEANLRTVDLIVDPTLDPDRLFEIPRVRELVRGREALLFTAPLMGGFRLDGRYLTERQRREVRERVGDADPGELDDEAHAELVRDLCGAEAGGIGDPARWTYANNILWEGSELNEPHLVETGLGDPLRAGTRRLRRARIDRSRDVQDVRRELEDTCARIGVTHAVRRDAEWAEGMLEPLAAVAITMSCYRSLESLAGMVRDGDDPLELLGRLESLDPLRGIGARLRHRIERLGAVSRDEDGSIDARALTDRFIEAARLTAEQMERAGLAIVVDRAGNLHGLLPSARRRSMLERGEIRLRDLCEGGLMHCSHIDTVKDAGKYDGRLGVLSGIEVAQALHELETYHGIPTHGPSSEVTLIVTAFLGEEMTFTGEGVSMPGSAAVTGRAAVERVHEMTNADGERLGDRLPALLRALRDDAQHGRYRLLNEFPSEGDGPELVSACAEPTDLSTPHTYERHIEQGPVLDRIGVPLALVRTIMGIHQEDVTVAGSRAEEAALELDARLRELSASRSGPLARVTVGVVDPTAEGPAHEDLSDAVRVTLRGSMNHAGATALEDRRDAGVAAGRLARWFRRWVDDQRAEGLAAGRALVGDLSVLPGANRNVIPGEASVTLGLRGESSEDARLRLRHDLEAWLAGTLSRGVADGGEGVLEWYVTDTTFLRTATEVRLSFDLRAADRETIESFLGEVGAALGSIAEEFGVEASREVEQELAPFQLAPTGQVLQIERSYGGSHNPDEVQLADDVLRGTVLQLSVSRSLLRRKRLGDLNLFRYVTDRVPRAWRERLDGFVSGALHDTCNVAAAAAAER